MNTTQTTAPVAIKTRNFSEMPGSNTYFRTSDCTPFFSEDGSLVVYNGKGDSRSWGTPSVRSTVKSLTANVIKVTVVGWHKHTVSPVGGSFYFVNEAGAWVRRTAGHKTVKAAIAAAVSH
ncbi:MAG: hypothetical protein IPK79_00260 [Vampirovibrionales bacterium]|nr:hypothetical protein [Vampirovibrionales bacterium]